MFQIPAGIRPAALAAVVTFGVLLTGCRSALTAAFDECVAAGRTVCALELAAIEVERRPSCCECLGRRALAEKRHALSGVYATDPAGLALALMRAARDYEHAAECGRSGATYMNAAHETMRLYREQMSDEDPAQWIAITSIEDRDRRIQAVIAHSVFFGSRCRHDVKSEYQSYVASTSARSLPEIRRHLSTFAATPFAAEMFNLYVARRVEEFPETADRELEVLEQVRIEFHGTPYAELATRALWAKASVNEDPSKVDRVCRRLGAGAVRDECHARAQTLWIAAARDASARQLADICPRIESSDLRAHCKAEWAAKALALVTENATSEDLALAEGASAGTSAEARRDWRIRLLKRDADRNYNRIVNREPEHRVDLAESVALWDDFISVFDTLARNVSDNRHESLRSIHPGLAARIEGRRAALARRADELFRRAARHCRETVDSLKTPGVSAAHTKRAKACVSDMAAVLTLDETHGWARGLLNDIEAAACHLASGGNADWMTVVVPLLITEALRNFVSPTLAQIVYRAMRATDFGMAVP